MIYKEHDIRAERGHVRVTEMKTGASWTEDTIEEILKKQQTADVRENVHGEWVKDEGGFDPRDCFYHCSKCGRTINIICGDTLENYPFCHCGADMRKGENNRK